MSDEYRRENDTGYMEPGYQITVSLFGKQLIQLSVSTSTHLNGSKPLLYFSFIASTAGIAGLMFSGVFFLLWVLNPQLLTKLLGG